VDDLLGLIAVAAVIIAPVGAAWYYLDGPLRRSRER
jgi:hypothetical protein